MHRTYPALIIYEKLKDRQSPRSTKPNLWTSILDLLGFVAKLNLKNWKLNSSFLGNHVIVMRLVLLLMLQKGAGLTFIFLRIFIEQ
jgi:hypothetical protein